MPSPPAEDSAEGTATPPQSPGELFRAFAWLSLQSFGGAVALIERTVVRDRKWLSSREFLGLYAVSQVLPGPTGISFCVLLGDRFFGVRGALATVAGFLVLPVIVVLSIASLFNEYRHVPQVQGALHGMGAAAVGVIASAVLRLMRNLRGQRVGVLVALLAFSAVGFLRVPVAWVVLTVGALSVVWAYRSLGKAA